MINKSTLGAIIGALGASFVAALCCSPLLIAFFGIGSALLSYISFFAIYRSYFIVIVVLLLGYSFYKLYMKPPPCGVDASCISPKMLSTQRWLFWITTIISIALLSIPPC